MIDSSENMLNYDFRKYNKIYSDYEARQENYNFSEDFQNYLKKNDFKYKLTNFMANKVKNKSDLVSKFDRNCRTERMLKEAFAKAGITSKVEENEELQ